MAENTTTTTTTQKPEDTTNGQGDPTKAPETTTTTTTVDESKSDRASQGDSAGNSADNTQVPSREESLHAAGTASPSSPDGGIDDGTKVLGQEGQSHEDRLDEARRDALGNAKHDQDLSA